MNDQEPTMSDDEVLRRVRILRGATNRRAVLKLADRLETVIAERDAAITKNDEQSAIIDALSETLNDAVRERDNAQCQRDAAILTAHKMEEKYAIEQMKRIAAEAIIGAAQRQLDAAIALMVEGMEGAVPGGPYIREWVLARIAERVALAALGGEAKG